MHKKSNVNSLDSAHMLPLEIPSSSNALPRNIHHLSKIYLEGRIIYCLITMPRNEYIPGENWQDSNF